MIKKTDKSSLIIVVMLVILFLLHGGKPATAGAETDLKQMKEALAKANYQYGKPEVIDRAYSGYEHLPEEVKKNIFWKDRIKQIPLKVDYYKLPTLFDFFCKKERYIATEIYLYDNRGKLQFTVWLNKESEVQQFVRHIPIKSVKKDPKSGIEIFQEEEIYYDKRGALVKRVKWRYRADNRKLQATYVRQVLAPDNSVLSNKFGDWDYDDLTCPSAKPHCH